MALPEGVLQQVLGAKRRYEAGLTPVRIDPRFGFELALCCVSENNVAACRTPSEPSTRVVLYMRYSVMWCLRCGVSVC